MERCMAFETRLTPAMAARWRGAGLWSDETLATTLAERVRATPDREALTDGTYWLSYRELAHGIDRMAARLRALGVGEGDVVTIQLPNWIEFALVFFALERIGAVAVTVSVDFRSRELECIGVARGVPRPGMVSLDDVAAGSGAPASFVPVRMDADTVMRMAFTSGTTGNPKGVMHSHNTTLAAARILNGDIGLAADDVMMIWLPLGLNWGYLTLVQAILAGAKAVLLDRFRPAAALDLIERERVTYIPTSPASLTSILQEPDLARRDLNSLHIVVSGGASAPVETIRAWRRAAPGVLLELLGVLASHMGLRLVDADGHDVASGEAGDICCDGPSVHLGYHNNPAANAEAFLPDGWFRSGDLGMIDADGRLRIVGRLKEMINRGGKKFFPREIEEILYTHPQVLYAAIVGIPDARLGERNCLCLVPRPGEPPTLEELVAFLGDSVATYKLPEHLELFTQFPFTPTGKIQRHALVREVVARMSH